MVGRSLSALQRDRRASLAGAGPAAPHLWHHHTQGLAPRVDGAHHQGPRRHSELRRRRGPSLLLRPCRRSQLDRAVAPLHLLRRGRAHLRSNITTPDPTSAHLPYSPLRLYWQVGSMTPSAASHAALDFAPQPAPQPIRRASSSSSSLLRRASNTGMAGLGGMDPADDRTSPSPLVPASAHHPCFHHLPTTPASIIGSPSLLYSIPRLTSLPPRSHSLDRSLVQATPWIRRHLALLLAHLQHRPSRHPAKGHPLRALRIAHVTIPTTRRALRRTSLQPLPRSTAILRSRRPPSCQRAHRCVGRTGGVRIRRLSREGSAGLSAAANGRVSSASRHAAAHRRRRSECECERGGAAAARSRACAPAALLS
jgi:hypothetical protein